MLYGLHARLKYHVQFEASVVVLAMYPDNDGLNFSARNGAVIVSAVLFVIGFRWTIYLALGLESRLLCFVYWLLSFVELGFVGWMFHEAAVNPAAAGSVVPSGVFFIGTACIFSQFVVNIRLFLYERNYFGKGLTEMVYREIEFFGAWPFQTAVKPEHQQVHSLEQP